ncbi:MAG: family 20 glycosylhydrolase, partial [Paludibacter sp.]|nr:family 20 glycosylhydrolase [Paludibacter sp.]
YLAFHKINYFHWHLIDDNGWRLEIKKYPRLTDMGAWRVERSQYFPMRANPEQGEPTPVGGYYSQEDVREIIRFAKERFIEIIPEIEMPAHSNSALAAYPHLACPVVDKYIGVLPGIGGKNANIIYCAGNDTVFTFLEDVLTEVMELFPSKYIHIGGDEANKENWQKCPKCQARMQENNIPDEEELQSYFIRRINRFLMNHGKQLMGWDELADSEIPENAVIFGWRNSGSGAEKAGGKGFQYVKCPALKYYFIRYQGPQWFEPYTYFGNTTLKDVYEYEPLSSHHPESVTRNMLGIEACLWTEFVNNTSDAEYLIFPRLAAFAESAWSKPEHKNWPDFIRRTDGLLNSYDALGINYARSMFNIEQVVRPLKGKLEIQLDNIRPDTKIKYTTDGTEPDLSSQDYTRPFAVEPAATVKAVTFRGNERVGKVLSLNTIDHKAAGAEVISKEVNGFVLTNGLRGSEKLTDGEWVDVYDRDAVFIIQLDRATTFSEVKLGLLNNAGMLVHLPSHVCISVSTDGEIFNPVAEKYYTEYERFQQGMFRTTLHFQFEEQTAAFLKLELKNPELTPDKHVRADVPTRLAVDEVMVK